MVWTHCTTSSPILVVDSDGPCLVQLDDSDGASFTGEREQQKTETSLTWTIMAEFAVLDSKVYVTLLLCSEHGNI
jgi:hypothetical protein